MVSSLIIQLTDIITVLKKPYKPADIEIRNVTRFSYGETTDGAYVLWAQGKSGWFEIQSAAHYESIFNDMVEAVELLYFVTDIYGERRKRAGRPSAALVFKEVRLHCRYSIRPLCADSKTVRRRRTLRMQRPCTRRANLQSSSCLSNDVLSQSGSDRGMEQYTFVQAL